MDGVEDDVVVVVWVLVYFLVIGEIFVFLWLICGGYFSVFG